jgi:oligoribonuclease NrnB/cAMP/cGMP phosphodiesterase (DHH superfamily)
MTYPLANVILYHGNCLDGMVAAQVLASGLHTTDASTTLIPVHYDRHNPELTLDLCTNRDVYIVDFSYDVEFTRELCAKANSVTFLDHHKTAIDRFAGLTADDIGENLHMVLDDTRSGAQLAWAYYVDHLACEPDPEWTGEEPWYVAHVGDRDLWKFELEGTKAITAALYTVIGDYHAFLAMLRQSREEVLAFGEQLLRIHETEIKQSISRQYYGRVANFTVPICNAYTHQSEIGNALSLGQPFAAVWYITGDQIRVSLRSQPDGECVETIAKMFGGGGHKHAAGFTLPVEHAMEFIPEGMKS